MEMKLLLATLLISLIHFNSCDENAASSANNDKVLSRRKRFLLFPVGASFSVATCMTIGVYGNPQFSMFRWGKLQRGICCIISSDLQLGVELGLCVWPSHKCIVLQVASGWDNRPIEAVHWNQADDAAKAPKGPLQSDGGCHERVSWDEFLVILNCNFTTPCWTRLVLMKFE